VSDGCGEQSFCRNALAEAAGGLVGKDLAVADVDYAVGILGDVGLVGDEDDGVAGGVEGVKEGHDLDAGLGVEIAGGLVGEDDGGRVDQGAGDGNALALTTGELVGLVVHARLEADVGERLLGALDALGRRSAVVDEGQLDVVEGCGAGQQVEGLEDEANLLVADAGELVVVEFADELAVEPVLAFRGSVEASDEVHESGFPGAGRSHNGDVLVVLDLHGDAAQGLDLLLEAHVVSAPKVLDHDHVLAGGRRGLHDGLAFDAVQSHLRFILFPM
jgi:hypothetical protein